MRPFLSVLLIFLDLLAISQRQALFLDENRFYHKYLNEDQSWYLQNIPFFECSDPQIEAVYYYRWKLYKAHLREVGPARYVVTEFINHVPWDRDPYCTINAASMHHIYEGRWLKDRRYMDGYIHYLCQQGGNNRRYSESIADAVYNRFLTNGDTLFAMMQLDSLKATFEQWSDHWDTLKNLYYIPAMPDATEYTIASIDASGGKDGFDDGEAFRPTINSYMYGNAMAIAKLAGLKGEAGIAAKYRATAASLKKMVEDSLWNKELQHFTDRFKVNNQWVHFWDYIRGRELAGMLPWYFNLPSDTKEFGRAWRHVLDTSELAGRFGLRTNEPSYPYYFKQFVYFEGQRGSQWNGPSWPYQTSQVLTGMTNLLHEYKQHAVSSTDFLHLFRLYTRQHYLPNGTLNLVENYDPNLGGPIVYYYWSNHYNHSSYNNILITGLCGLRPSDSDTLELDPLIDSSIQYFFLSGLPYHGHFLDLAFDRYGTKYKRGTGLLVWVNGVQKPLIRKNRGYAVLLPRVKLSRPAAEATNVALNIDRKGYPVPDASTNANPDSLYQAIDGRIWFFPEISNRWTTKGSRSGENWYGLRFGKPQQLSRLQLYFFCDGRTFDLPDDIRLAYHDKTGWHSLPLVKQGKKLKRNAQNEFFLPRIKATTIRLHFRHNKAIALTELKSYE